MKKLYILLLVAVTGLSLPSCSGWLDVAPEDIVEEKDLFAEGEGYRNALNGVYRMMSSSSLFGQELTWGMADFMSHSYPSYNFSTHAYAELMKFKYTTKKTKPLIQGVWEAAYNTIANSNNIIAKIESEPISKFKGGKMEKEMILGEALAARAFLHFQMLCYFAPSLAQKHDGNWIPYYEKFSSEGANYIGVEPFLELCIRDLKRAVELIEPFDLDESTETNHKWWLGHSIRFFSPQSGAASWPDDIFYAYRGYRLNVLAVRAILARVYSYAGKSELASAEAQKVIDFKVNSSTRAFEFTTTGQVLQDYKMSNDLIFALSDLQLQTNYASVMSKLGGGDADRVNLGFGYDTDKFDSQSDYRMKTLLEKKGSYSHMRRYKTPTAGGSAEILDALPVIRLSEMYYIQAEHQASAGNLKGATELLDIVRDGRDCPVGLLDGKITSHTTFVDELLKETRREFLEEGLIFYYYKKYGRSLLSRGTMKDADYYFPLPDTETI